MAGSATAKAAASVPARSKARADTDCGIMNILP
jgi:hypothetical protein